MNRLFSVKNNPACDEKYTKRINIPQYLPSNVKPELYQLCDKSKYIKLLSNIAVANVDTDIKDFLKLAASRHIVFDYAKIADYYAHADAETQKLMEQSALVIIDVDDAIANGYIKLSKNIDAIMKKSGVLADER